MILVQKKIPHPWVRDFSTGGYQPGYFTTAALKQAGNPASWPRDARKSPD